MRRRLSAIILFLNNYSNRLASIISDYLRGRLSSIIFDIFYFIEADLFVQKRFICSTQQTSLQHSIFVKPSTFRTIYLFNPERFFATQHFCGAIFATQNDLFVRPRTIYCEAIYLWRHDLFVQERFMCSTQKTSYVKHSIYAQERFMCSTDLCATQYFCEANYLQDDLFVQPRTILKPSLQPSISERFICSTQIDFS